MQPTERFFFFSQYWCSTALQSHIPRVTAIQINFVIQLPGRSAATEQPHEQNCGTRSFSSFCLEILHTFFLLLQNLNTNFAGFGDGKVSSAQSLAHNKLINNHSSRKTIAAFPFSQYERSVIENSCLLKSLFCFPVQFVFV